MKRVIIVVVEEPATATDLKQLAALATNVITQGMKSGVLASSTMYNTPTYKAKSGHISMFANTDNLTLMSRIVTYTVGMLSRRAS